MNQQSLNQKDRKGMKNTRLSRWITLVALATASLVATSCGNVFWKAEQTVVPMKRGPLAFSDHVPNRVARGLASTTLHTAEGDTIPHRWENGKLKFFKSENTLYLVARDANGELESCTGFYFRERTYFRQKGGIPRRKLPWVEQQPYAAYASAIGSSGALLYNSVNPYDGFTPLLLIVLGGTADLVTYPVGLVLTQRDPRRSLGLVQIRPLGEDQYPDFLAQTAGPIPSN